MIPILIYAQGCDLITFLIAADTLGFEGNEYGVLANAIYHSAGIAGIAVVKVLLVALIVIVIASLPPSAQGMKRFGALFAIVLGTLGAFVNVMALAVAA